MKKFNLKTLLILFSSSFIMYSPNQLYAQTWSAVGDGSVITNTVESLAFDGSTLIAGGSFDLGNDESYIDKWNGTSWSSLGTTSILGSSVLALEKYSSGVAVGGAFNYIYNWNGTSLSSIGYIGANTRAFTLDGSGNLYQGGDNDKVEEYSGSSWSAIGGLFSASIYSLVEYNGDLYAGGHFTSVNGGGTTANYIAKWNGTTWSAVGSGMNANVNALIVFNGNLYAGGNFTTAGGTSAKYIAVWNGSTWSAIGSGMNSYVLSFALDGTGYYLYAGGDFTTANGTTVNHVAFYVGGTTWYSLGSGTNNGTNNDVFALAVDGTDSYMYVGGSFTSAGGSTSIQRIAKWSIPPTRLEGVGQVIDNNSAKIYPSPNNGIFTVELHNPITNSKIEVYSILGQEIYTAKLNSTNTKINLGQPSQGIYVYRIILEDGSLISSGRFNVE
jgi:hypothetical protein